MVYKYIPSDGIARFFEEAMLRFTQLGSYYLDSEEGLPNVTYDPDLIIDEVANRNIGQFANINPTAIGIAKIQYTQQLKTNPEKLKDEVRRIIRHHQDEKIGVLCLANAADNLYLWLNYTKLNGIAVGFDEKHAFFNRRLNDMKGTGELRNVIYSNIPVQINLHDFRIVIELFFTKRESYAPEKELRMVRELKNADKVIDAPNWPVCLFKVDPFAIQEVVLSPAISASDESLVMDCLKRTAYSHIKVRRTEFVNRGGVITGEIVVG